MTEKKPKEARKGAEKVVYMTDGHGEINAYDRLFEAAKKPEVLAVLIGGDVSPRHILKTQMDFLKAYLAPKIAEFKKKYGKETYLILGNADFMECTKILTDFEEKGILTLAHNSVCKMKGGYEIVGYHYLNPTPTFWFAEWEKTEPEIKQDLENLAKHVKNMRKTIFLFHAPPLDTDLDITSAGRHMGSLAIRGFIDHRKPLVTLHGHIHESPEKSGSIYQMLGRDKKNPTLAINPGNTQVVEIDLKTLKVKKV